MVQWMTKINNEWQRMTMSDNKCQRVTTSDIMSDNEWQQVVQRIKTNERKRKRVTLGFKIKQKANLIPERFHSIFMPCITTIYSGI